MAYSLRALSVKDEPILWEMLMLAAHEVSLATVKATPALARYVQNWGRQGDVGVVALSQETAIGAAWLRLWPEDDRGYGYFAQAVPELAIAVLPDHRAQGVGTALLKQTLKIAQTAFPAVSLSTRADNPAIRLYQRAGFVKVAGSEVINRTGGGSFTMVRDLRAAGGQLIE
jgi:ribosomal protein S18 acetylase RimI-like enzyme